MARVKKSTRVKEPVRLRMKALTNGNYSLYLDIYHNGQRSYEYLKMYLIPETDNNARNQNQAILAAANKIKTKRIIELANQEAGTGNNALEAISLSDWMNIYKKNQKEKGKKDSEQIKVATRILGDYVQTPVLLEHIDKEFCQGFINYLIEKYRPNGKTVSNYTLYNYYRVFNSALNAAVRAGHIKVNPFTQISSDCKIHKPECRREYMTLDEIRTLIATPMKNREVKSAYLFSCFCGLRIGNIRELKWSHIYINNGQYHLKMEIRKGKSPIHIPLSSEAVKWMPERGQKKADDYVFDLPSTVMISLLIKSWGKAAGIQKKITFQTARNTFAAMMLTLGADLYTTSQLLGLSDIKMALEYAKMIEQHKGLAVNLTNGLFE